MNPEIKKRWLEALPKYKKGKSYLKSGDCFCALGVLCDLYSKETEHTWGPPERAANGRECQLFLGWRFTIALEVSEWSGIKSTDTLYRIWWLNDHSDTFEPVIKYIEENL